MQVPLLKVLTHQYLTAHDVEKRLISLFFYQLHSPRLNYRTISLSVSSGSKFVMKVTAFPSGSKRRVVPLYSYESFSERIRHLQQVVLIVVDRFGHIHRFFGPRKDLQDHFLLMHVTKDCLKKQIMVDVIVQTWNVHIKGERR